MSAVRYEISKEFKQGVTACILRENHDWDRKPAAFLAGYKFASDNLTALIFDGVNNFLEGLGMGELAMASVQDSNA